MNTFIKLFLLNIALFFAVTGFAMENLLKKQSNKRTLVHMPITLIESPSISKNKDFTDLDNLLCYCIENSEKDIETIQSLFTMLANKDFDNNVIKLKFINKLKLSKNFGLLFDRLERKQDS